jgi:hypothetical protein
MESKALDISCRNRHPCLLFDPLFLLYNVIWLVVGLAVHGMLKVVVCCFNVGNNSFGELCSCPCSLVYDVTAHHTVHLKHLLDQQGTEEACAANALRL